MERESSWNELMNWLKYTEVDPWEVSSVVKEFCDSQGREYPNGEDDPFSIENFNKEVEIEVEPVRQSDFETVTNALSKGISDTIKEYTNNGISWILILSDISQAELRTGILVKVGETSYNSNLPNDLAAKIMELISMQVSK